MTLCYFFYLLFYYAVTAMRLRVPFTSGYLSSPVFVIYGLDSICFGVDWFASELFPLKSKIIALSRDDRKTFILSGNSRFPFKNFANLVFDALLLDAEVLSVIPSSEGAFTGSVTFLIFLFRDSNRMNSEISDPGLFDTPLPQSTPSSNSDVPSENRQNVRRVYRPVPAEKRNSKEYRVSRERNNKAVQRCRANYKVKQDCLVIKSEGYRALAEEHLKAAREMDVQRKVKFYISSVTS